MKDKATKIVINNIRIPYQASRDNDAAAIHKAASAIFRKTGEHPRDVKISKKSIDARRRGEISFVYSVYAVVELSDKSRALDDPDIKRFTEPELTVVRGSRKMQSRPVIVGFGPAGMFAGLILAENGFRPIIFERGADVDSRTAAVERFISGGELDVNTNIQFGAGGAGTFSDGKLTTRIGDKSIAYVLKRLCELGADPDIEYKAKPHIGTDVLREVVKNADRIIRERGGEIYYNTTVESIAGTKIKACGADIPYDALILATGHSARDTYGELLRRGFIIEPKPFSVGVRIEHLQADIDRAMYGDFAGDKTLGAADYQLSYRSGNRGCYTFCMCPGGTVVPSASEEGGVVTNGMSNRARDGRNANSAVCVSVLPEDYGSDPAQAIEFQRELERRAFLHGGGRYYAPMQTVGDFLEGKSGTEYTRIVPTYRGGLVVPCDFNRIFPGFVTDMLKSGLVEFGKRINGFTETCVPMTGVETRTSAPVRITRGETLTAPGFDHVYPCGEGAGYAGGIMSAAVDGIRVALRIISEYCPD